MRILYLFKEHFKCEKSEITKYYESAECKLFFLHFLKIFIFTYLVYNSLWPFFILFKVESLFFRQCCRVCSSDSVGEFVLKMTWVVSTASRRIVDFIGSDVRLNRMFIIVFIGYSERFPDHASIIILHCSNLVIGTELSGNC